MLYLLEIFKKIFYIQPKQIKCVFPTYALRLQDRKIRSHLLGKAAQTYWWKIYFILNILQYWMIKREKNRGIEFCIMSVKHTGNKIHNGSKPTLQLRLNKCPLCLLARVGPHGWELARWCQTPVNKYIQVTGQRRPAPTERAGGWCSRYVWKIDSCTVKEHRSLHGPSREFSQSHENKGLAVAQCGGLPRDSSTVVGMETVADTSQENTATSKSSGWRQGMRLLGFLFTSLCSLVTLNWLPSGRGTNASLNYFLQQPHWQESAGKLKSLMRRGSTCVRAKCKLLSPSLSLH